MNRSLMSGFSASKCDASFRASVICAFETIAMVTVLPEDPKDPAPAHPARVRTAVNANASATPIGCRFTSHLVSYLMSQKPTRTFDIAHQILGEAAAQRAER